MCHIFISCKLKHVVQVISLMVALRLNKLPKTLTAVALRYYKSNEQHHARLMFATQNSLA